MPVAEAQSRIDAREFAEWIAFGNVEPFGYERIELAIAVAASAICNTWGAKVKPKDLIPDYEKAKPQTEQEMERLLDVYVERVNTFFEGNR